MPNDKTKLCLKCGTELVVPLNRLLQDKDTCADCNFIDWLEEDAKDES